MAKKNLTVASDYENETGAPRGRAARAALAFAALVAALVSGPACNALSGVEDLQATSDSCTSGSGGAFGGDDDGCTATSSRSGPDNPAQTTDGTDPTPGPGRDGGGGGGTDAGVDASPADPGPPTYCDGILLYLRFDGTTTGARGEVATQPNDNTPPTYDAAGKFGQAIFLKGAGDAFFWPANAATFVDSIGTASMWLKSTWTFPANTTRNILKATNDLSTGGVGVSTTADSNTFGIGSALNSSQATLDVGSAANYWQPNAYNHVAYTWNDAPAAGEPTFSVMLNGDASNSTATYATTTSAWTSQTAKYARLGSQPNPPSVYADDVAFWGRVLTTTELKALAAATKPIGDVCPIR